MSILKQCNVLDFFETREQQGIFTERIAEEPEHLQLTDEQYWKPWFNYNFGVGEIRPCWLVDVHALLDKWRQELTQSNSLIEEQFDWKDCEVSDGRVSYKGVTARAIICCEGVAAADNPYFSLLPYSINKGEAIIATIRGLPTNNIYKQGLKIVPGKNDLFWIGASFEWKYESKQPTETFRKKVEQHLQYRLKLPYNIMEHIAAERPSTVDYKPFVGMHPAHPAVGIFNGLGTKGCSLAPYFAAQLSQHLLDGSAIMPDVDVQRFARILSR
jgi:glycine/D-amino acid oxidase-like deaminating enzyme